MGEPAWIAAARRDIGNPESLGPNDSPLVRRIWAAVSAAWLRGQPWCGGAAAYWMQHAGIAYPREFYRAKAWLGWGVELATPVPGCVAVFERQGGGHVGFVVGRDTAGRLMVLGGNQGDAVRISPFDAARVTGYRWPTGVELPAGPLPVLTASGASSVNEA